MGSKGKGSSGGNSRIVGGTETKPNAYPSAVSLQRAGAEPGPQIGHWCTGFLIDESWVSILDASLLQCIMYYLENESQGCLGDIFSSSFDPFVPFV